MRLFVVVIWYAAAAITKPDSGNLRRNDRIDERVLDTRKLMVLCLRQIQTVRRVRQIFTVFVSLQILDVLTTLLGLSLGAGESSVFVAKLIQSGPVSGLLLSKAIALSLAMWALVANRERLVRFVNFWFAALVGWNLLVISVARSRL